MLESLTNEDELVYTEKRYWLFSFFHYSNTPLLRGPYLGEYSFDQYLQPVFVASIICFGQERL
jgi:hypothetical protein